jgi:hypothetical protein
MMMPMMQEVTTNYRTAGLSLKTDPLALIPEDAMRRDEEFTIVRCAQTTVGCGLALDPRYNLGTALRGGRQ